jgi:Leucine-rich repeat (LRR) protein
VSNNINLAFLDCSGNELSNLDISANTKLTCLLAYNNRLSSLDVSRNVNLNRLWLFGNSFSDDETSRLTAILEEVVKGDLWISNGQLDNE